MKGIQPYIHPSLILLSCWLIFRTSAVSLSSSNVSLRGFMGGVDYVDVGLGGDRPASWLWSPRAYVGLAFGVVSQGGSLISFWMDLGSFKTFHKSHLPFWGRRAWSKQVLKTTVRFLTVKQKVLKREVHLEILLYTRIYSHFLPRPRNTRWMPREISSRSYTFTCSECLPPPATGKR